MRVLKFYPWREDDWIVEEWIRKSKVIKKSLMYNYIYVCRCVNRQARFDWFAVCPGSSSAQLQFSSLPTRCIITSAVEPRSVQDRGLLLVV